MSENEPEPKADEPADDLTVKTADLAVRNWFALDATQIGQLMLLQLEAIRQTALRQETLLERIAAATMGSVPVFKGGKRR